MMFGVQGADATFEFFKDLPKDGSTREELAAFKKDWVAAGGLIWASTMPAMLGVSRQRWHQMKQEYEFKTYHHFGKNFVSYPIAIEFCKVQRPNGPNAPAKALKAIMRDLASD